MLTSRKTQPKIFDQLPVAKKKHQKTPKTKAIFKANRLLVLSVKYYSNIVALTWMFCLHVVSLQVGKHVVQLDKYSPAPKKREYTV